MTSKFSHNGDNNTQDRSSPDYALPRYNLENNGIEPKNPSFKDQTPESSMVDDLSISDTTSKSLLVSNEDNQPTFFMEQKKNGNT